MANISFGERMRRARVKAAWSQAEVGEKLDVTGATIGNWEKGKTSPDKDQKAKLRAVLGMLAANALDSAKPSEDESAGREDEGPSPLGTWLNRARLGRKMTVAELAHVSGLSAPAIYNIESGRIANPRDETTRRLEKALGTTIPVETKNEVREEAEIEGVGEFKDFLPHDDEDRPAVGGVYVLYDVAERPVYVGEGGSIKKRIRDHHEKFWFKSPIVESAAYVQIEDERLRRKVEAILIRFLKSNAVINKKNVDR